MRDGDMKMKGCKMEPLNKYVLLSVSSGQPRELYYWGK